MTEKYLGVKFKTIFIKQSVPRLKGIEKLDYWCKRFSKAKLAPKVGKGSAGNMSFRTKKGFIITKMIVDFIKNS